MSVDIIIHQSDNTTMAPIPFRLQRGEHARIIIRENNQDRVVWQGEAFDEKRWVKQMAQNSLTKEERDYAQNSLTKEEERDYLEKLKKSIPPGQASPL